MRNAIKKYFWRTFAPNLHTHKKRLFEDNINKRGIEIIAFKYKNLDIYADSPGTFFLQGWDKKWCVKTSSIFEADFAHFLRPTGPKNVLKKPTVKKAKNLCVKNCVKASIVCPYAVSFSSYSPITSYHVTRYKVVVVNFCLRPLWPDWAQNWPGRYRMDRSNLPVHLIAINATKTCYSECVIQNTF